MELNGRPVSSGELASLALYGYGHFTTMLVTNLRVRGLNLHLERLSRDCRTLYNTELDIPRVRELALRSARAHPSPSVVRVTVYDPHMDLGRPGRQHPHILVTTRPAPDPAVTPAPVRLGTRQFTRDTPQVKGTALFGSIRQRRAAQLDGYDDALFTGVDGRISEGPTWNIGFLSGGGVVWPQAPCLPGVTADLIDRVAGELEMSVSTRPITTASSTRMAGAFVTNATMGLRTVTSIDDVNLPQSALARKLAAAYSDLRGEAL